MLKIKLGLMSSVAIGDSYGAAFEYRKYPFNVANDGRTYHTHPTHTDFTQGHYTDDTQMSIAVLEVMRDFLLQATPVWPTHEEIAERFAIVYHRDKFRGTPTGYRPGYAKGMHAAFKAAHDEGLPVSVICERFGKSEKSGAAMRATPIGILSDIAMVRSFARHQGSVTHQGTALDAAEAVALASHYMHYNLGPREELLHFVAKQMNNNIWLKPWKGKVGSPGMESARAALTAVVQAATLEDLLIRCCAFTGDVDTVGAIAMGCAWKYEDLENDLKQSLQEGLENGTYGRDFLFKMDDQFTPGAIASRLAA